MQAALLFCGTFRRNGWEKYLCARKQHRILCQGQDQRWMLEAELANFKGKGDKAFKEFGLLIEFAKDLDLRYFQAIAYDR